ASTAVLHTDTAAVKAPQGYCKSDYSVGMDELGYVTNDDRKKDMILVTGFNVYPNEIEAVVSGHPGVRECAAVGVPDSRSGEAVKLFVVKRDPALTEQELLDFCAKNLTNYKRPRQVEFRADLPKSNIGKILRRELRDAPAKKPTAEVA